jgi:Ca2+-transporting ATPase
MEGILRNTWFIIIQVIIIGGQILIVSVGGKAFPVQQLDQPSQWAVSILLGAFAVPVGGLIRMIPDTVISKIISYIWPRMKRSQLDVSRNSRPYRRDLGWKEISDQLAFMNRVRGGRLRHIIHKHPQVFFQSRRNSKPPYTSMPPTVVEETAANDNTADSYSTSAPVSERTPLIRGNGTSPSRCQV